jgi:hypothetical protein
VRCEEISILALISHPRYRNQQALRKTAIKAVKNCISRWFDFWVVEYLPKKDAQAVMKDMLPVLIKLQRSTGMWKSKYNKHFSCGVLLALHHAGLLNELLARNILRYDPLKPFKVGITYYDLVVRGRIIGENGAVTRAATRMATKILKQQNSEGSWNKTVISTCSHIDQLIHLDADIKNHKLQLAAQWLLERCIEDVDRISPTINGVLVGHNMFSIYDRKAEYCSALKLQPQWDPKVACYMHLPIIQNGYAIRTLICLGYAGNRKIIRACENLLELRRIFGGYCNSNIRRGLEARGIKGNKGTRFS